MADYLSNDIDASPVIEALQAEVAKTGSQAAAAKKLGITGAYVSDLLAGKREPGGKVLRALGFLRVVRYIKAAP